MWAGFTFFWEFLVIRMRAPWFFALWGIPFVCVGLYLIGGRFLYDSWVRARTYYAVTSRRVLVLSLRRVRTLVALDLGSTSVSTEERSDGSGSIVFGSAALGPPLGFRGRRADSPSFERIPAVRAAAAVIADAKEKLRTDR